MRQTGPRVTVQHQMRLGSQAYTIGILLTLLMVLIALSGAGVSEVVVVANRAVETGSLGLNRPGLWR